MIEVQVGKVLTARGETLAVAESCTGGVLAGRITDVPGSSAYFLGGVVAYSNQAKVNLLGVPPEVLRTRGAVSPECARAMAAGARERFGATYALATTGIAGPGGGTPEKPVGLVYVALASPDGIWAEEHRLPGGRAEVRRQACDAALALLLRHLEAR